MVIFVFTKSLLQLMIFIQYQNYYTMQRVDGKYRQHHQSNPQQHAEQSNTYSKSYQTKQEKLNSQLLRIRSQYIQKLIEQTWQMNQQELLEFFNTYQTLCQLVDVQYLLSSDCKLVRTDNKIYLGQIRAKKKHGMGITVYKEGRIYEGNYADNEKSGQGCEIYSNGNVYIGEYSQNKKHGKGTFFWFSICENSATKERHNKVEQYQGTWWGGLPDGEGQHEKYNGDFYLGNFKNGLKHGKGVEYYFNGDKYDGEYVNGLPEGFGEYSWSDASYFKGDFKQGYRNGYGVWNDAPPSGQSYKGHYMLDKKHGYGVYDWGNGYIYKGNFIQDQRNGQGQLYYNQQLAYDGYWSNGQRCDKDDFQMIEGDLKQNNSKISTKIEGFTDKRLKGHTKKSPEKQDKKQNSFIINFKQVQPQPKHCIRGCLACKSKEKKVKTKQRKTYVISRGKK